MNGSTLKSVVPMPSASILPARDARSWLTRFWNCQVIDPIDQADADREGRVEEREEHVAEAQQVAAGLVGVAFGRLRLDGSALALEAQVPVCSGSMASCTSCTACSTTSSAALVLRLRRMS